VRLESDTSMKYRDGSAPYINLLDEEILKKAIDLDSIGVHEYAWPYDVIMKIIEVATNNSMLILGGDILVMESGNPIHTGDNWSYNEKDISGSKDRAIEYLKNYVNRNGDNFLVVLVVDSTRPFI
jgi:hypothetical protein